MCLRSNLQDWALELEDVFAVAREGEAESYTPFKKSLDNHMLLWHGQLTSSHYGMFLFCFSPFDYVVLGSKKIQTLVDELELIPANNLQVLEQQTTLEF